MQWWRQIVDSREIQLFRRVQSVEFTGKQFTHADLQKVSDFKQLRSLVLNGTSVTPTQLTQ